MRVLYIYCHPLADSFHAGILKESLAGLKRAGHEVDLLDLYAEGFDPVLSAEGRRNYHDTTLNRAGLEDYVARLQSCEALVLQFPTWCFGMPAMLKGYFDRLLMPGVSIDLTDAKNVKPMLGNIRKIAGISTYGRQRWVALYMGDPSRVMVMKYMRRLTAGNARAEYHALYHMNIATDAQRHGFIAKVGVAMARF